MKSQPADDVQVRPLQPEDVPALLGLIQALANYEDLPPPDAEARERLSRDALAEPPRFHALLATLGGRVVGYAIYFETYSTFLARPTLYLEDLFVLPEARRHGVGATLFSACAAEAVRRSCGRMEWAVLDWNALALSFYTRWAPESLDEWRLHRLTGDALQQAARDAPGPP